MAGYWPADHACGDGLLAGAVTFTVTREKPAERHGDDGYAGGAGTGVASGSTHERQPVAAVVPDGSAAPLLRSQRDDFIYRILIRTHAVKARPSVPQKRAGKITDPPSPTARAVTEDGEKRPAGGRSAVDAAAAHYRRSRAGGGEIGPGEAWLDEAYADRRTIPAKGRSAATAFAMPAPSSVTVATCSRASAGRHTTLSRIIRMVRRAQSSKPEIYQLADKNLRGIAPSNSTYCAVQRRYLVFLRIAPQIVYIRWSSPPPY